ncbi:VOC family protein [Chloroflexia bacterium SDU3-3]|nr:VOC family protein [Chloroflexia bacterium SDU3-3]
MHHFSGICIITDNVPRLRDFYCAVLQTDVPTDELFVSIPLGATALSLFRRDGIGQIWPGLSFGGGSGGYTIEFEVADVDAEHARLSALGADILKPPTTQPWGRRSVWLRDPDGNIINFSAPVAL